MRHFEDRGHIVMEVNGSPIFRTYFDKLSLDLEKERIKVVRAAIPHTPPDGLGELIAYSKRFYLTKYLQMGVNRRWHDFYKEVEKNYRLDKEGRQDEMTMPEMMEDQENWTAEDLAVYAALKASKKEPLKS